MKLIIQPDAGIAPILTAIKRAKKSIDILIFRLDRADIARALQDAVARGVRVRALTAHTNRGGEKSLRRLEMQLLEGGVTVSRTADDLVRYHGKMMIVDGRQVHIFGFNFTTLDIGRSRSFAVISRNARLVAEAQKLFDADFDRQPYAPGSDRLVVSPENARDRLAAFIRGARQELLIYDLNLSDDTMLRLIMERIEAGVEVRVIGEVEDKWELKAEKFPGKRLHVRAIIRDGSRAFVGSQSLRRLELEKRREIGVVVTDRSVVRKMKAVFEEDWALTGAGRKEARRGRADAKSEKKEAALAAVS